MPLNLWDPVVFAYENVMIAEDKLKDKTKMLYTFYHLYYFFVVKKVDIIKAPGYRKIARILKVVFEAYRRDDEGNLVRCDEERIAQHFYQVFSNGYWHTQNDHDHQILEALGLPPTLDHSLDLEKRLNGRWIEGLPGPPGPDGFNPLEEFKAIQSPVPTVFHPAPPASTTARTPAISLADTSASADCPSRQVTDWATGGLHSVPQSTRGMGSDCFESTSTAPNPAVPARGTPRQSHPLEDKRTQIGLVEASEFYDIPKSVLSKAAAKNPGTRGYLPSIRKGRRVSFYREDIQNLSRSREQMKRRSKQPAKVPDLAFVSRLFHQD